MRIADLILLAALAGVLIQNKFLKDHLYRLEGKIDIMSNASEDISEGIDLLVQANTETASALDNLADDLETLNEKIASGTVSAEDRAKLRQQVEVARALSVRSAALAAITPDAADPETPTPVVDPLPDVADPTTPPVEPVVTDEDEIVEDDTTVD